MTEVLDEVQKTLVFDDDTDLKKAAENDMKPWLEESGLSQDFQDYGGLNEILQN